MRDFKIKISIGFIIVFVLFSMNFIVVANPVINNVTTNPENPEPVSTVTITADISGENISRVNLTISACNDDICFTDLTQKVEMTLNSQGKYQAKITLNDSKGKADHIKYLFEITLYNGTEYRHSDPSWKADIKLGTTSDNDDAGDNSTPGFEFIFVLVALFISLLTYYKKR